MKVYSWRSLLKRFEMPFQNSTKLQEKYDKLAYYSLLNGRWIHVTIMNTQEIKHDLSLVAKCCTEW